MKTILVAMRLGETPVHIPNTMVKTQTADDTILDLPIRLPCYDFTPVIDPAFGSSLLAVGPLTSGITNSHGVTGGVYKTRERIHRDILIRDY